MILDLYTLRVVAKLIKALTTSAKNVPASLGASLHALSVNIANYCKLQARNMKSINHWC